MYVNLRGIYSYVQSFCVGDTLKRSSILVAGAVIAVVVGSIYAFLTPSGLDDAKAKPQALPVSVITIAKEQLHLVHRLPGRVSAFRQAQIRPQVDGIITKRLFEEGAKVKKGDQLYQIDDTRYLALYKSALADLESARSNVKAIEAKAARYRELTEIAAVSKQEFDNVVAELDSARAAVAVAQSAVDLAKVDLDYTKVYAPISGNISKSIITEGALVTASQEQHLAVITQLDPVYIDLQQSGTEHLYVRSRLLFKGEVPVSVDLGAGVGVNYPHLGKIIFSEVTIDETTGSVAMRAEIPNPDGVLLPGLFVTAIAELGDFELVMIPQRAATRKPDGSLEVWVVDANNHVQPRAIQSNHESNNRWIVVGGLELGERVVIEGYHKLRPGMAVIPKAWQQEQESEPDQTSAPKAEALANKEPAKTESVVVEPVKETPAKEASLKEAPANEAPANNGAAVEEAVKATETAGPDSGEEQ